jgi:hypothetical protein
MGFRLPKPVSGEEFKKRRGHELPEILVFED